jgi:hypothetical protein
LTQGCKLGSPKKFLRGEGYFLEKFVGKKPISGLYTDEEFSILVKYWEEKVASVKESYKTLPDTWQEIVGERKLATLLERFPQKTPPKIKEIENAKERRIPYLLVSTGVGRNRRQLIAKGSTLAEKLKYVGGGDNPRIPSRVMWSPLDGQNINFVTDLGIKSARLTFQRKPEVLERLIAEASKASGGSFLGYVDPCMNKVQQITTLLLELYQDRKGDPAWDTMVF